MNPYVQYLREQMAAREMDQPELVRRSGLTRANVHRILKDDRETFSRPPERVTIAALARALSIPESRLWVKVAQSMGLPVGEIEVANAADLTDDELVREITRRLATRQSGKPQLHVVVDPNDVEDPEDFDNVAAHTDPEPAGPPDDRG